MTTEIYEYDVAISYASEDHYHAEALADILRKQGVHVFYDKYEKAVLWGQDLYTYLSDLYQNKSRYCILFLSKYYAAKLWTKHELQAAQSRALREQNAYILPIRLDDTEILGILPTTAYLDWFQETPESIAGLLVEKLKAVSHDYSTFAKRLSQEAIINFLEEATSQVVLILGRFTLERKTILDAIKNEMSKYNYAPILFDFEIPHGLDFTETLSALAHLSRFIIADVTEPSSIPYEIMNIASNNIKPIQPLFQPTETAPHEFAMLKDLQQRHYWVLPTYQYHIVEDLITSLQDKVIAPAERMLDEIALRRKAE